MKKINKEFEELMFTKTEGRMIQKLKVSRIYGGTSGSSTVKMFKSMQVRDYFLGTSVPVIHNATVVKVEGGPEDTLEIQVLACFRVWQNYIHWYSTGNRYQF